MQNISSGTDVLVWYTREQSTESYRTLKMLLHLLCLIPRKASSYTKNIIKIQNEII
jgi:hypothetical protein